MQLYNTLSRQLETVQPIEGNTIKMYCCGPTVYGYAHIGNMRAYVVQDILKRTLMRSGFNVRHAMNITDVGHLTSDADAGKDKMLVAAEREKKGVMDIARFYEKCFFDHTQALNIIPPHVVCRATDHIADMIVFVQGLEEKGYAYRAGGNVYFDTSKYPGYGQLAKLDIQNLKHGARTDTDSNKKNPTDFVLWFTASKFSGQILQWDSPWGRGYPGWHIECSAMATKYLGDQIDIHCGGIDHVPVHHENERAQSECYLGHSWVKMWVHNEFLQLKDEKMSKSKGNVITIDTLRERGYHPLAFRYLCLTGHYRSILTFSYDNLTAAQKAFDNLTAKVAALDQTDGPLDTSKMQAIMASFDAHLQNDLATPQALAVMWDMLKNNTINEATKWALLQEMDSVLGFHMVDMHRQEVLLDQELRALLDERARARQHKDWARSDAIRDIFASRGFVIKDRADGTVEVQKK